MFFIKNTFKVLGRPLCEYPLIAAKKSKFIDKIYVATDSNKIIVDEFYNTNIPGYFAIGDIIKGPALAHVASAEAITAVEYICNKKPLPSATSASDLCSDRTSPAKTRGGKPFSVSRTLFR